MLSVVILKKLTGKEILWQVFICLPEAQNPLPSYLTHCICVLYSVYRTVFLFTQGRGVGWGWGEVNQRIG
jgi:hypothetical protein